MKNVSDEFLKYLDNPFVSDYNPENGRISYSKDFYVTLFKKIDSGMSHVEAYESLGFDTSVLGVERAYSACRRAKKMMEKTDATIDPSNYDGSVERHLMGEMTREEEFAYMQARTIYLESLVECYKKKPEIIQEILSSLKKR